jgi:hypothetical protein
MTNPTGPTEFFSESLNAAKDNLCKAIERLEVTAPISAEKLMKIAEIQTEMAKATALVMVAQAIQACSTPGDSIRYGVAEVAAALRESR